MRSLVVALVLMLVAGCGALREDLNRAQQSYQDARYQDAMTWLEAMDGDAADMDRPERARYFYLRGMTAYRLGQRDDALHYLALAREEGTGNQALDAPERKQMERALGELTPEDASAHARPSS